MKNMKKTLCALAMMAATASAFAADSVDVKVIGTISPAACAPTLGGGGTVDYGTIPANTLAADDYTVLSLKSMNLTITCDAPAKLAIHAVNGRPGTSAGVTETGPMNSGYAPVDLFSNHLTPIVGLGTDGSANDIGGYGIQFTDGSVTADGNAVDVLYKSTAEGDNTFNSGNAEFYSDKYDRLISWGATGTTTPVSFTTLSGTMEIQAYLNKASELDLTKEVQLDGLTTIELVYL
ncbi:DUF1120 domain-containing protein [Dryocola clanedunensis]|uniref:DUF1120 domain-containing protein n=1 Tax=Cedecea sulfonylureivorans TaxID=3051154 RepID=UPI001F234334|nr:DUF1120 domain-containing protein [Cedecea sulfonylureivorans]